MKIKSLFIFSIAILFSCYVSARSTYVENCALDQQSTISSAIYEARTQARNAYEAINNGYINGNDKDIRQIYTKWFGADPDGKRPLYVRDTFGFVVHFFDNADIKYACVTNKICNKAVAYVHPRNPRLSKYDLWSHICPVFFSSDFEYQWSSLIHEMTHFPSVRGTDDSCYGLGCLSTAVNSPEKAIRNADSYSEFAKEISRLK